LRQTFLTALAFIKHRWKVQIWKSMQVIFTCIFIHLCCEVQLFENSLWVMSFWPNLKGISHLNKLLQDWETVAESCTGKVLQWSSRFAATQTSISHRETELPTRSTTCSSPPMLLASPCTQLPKSKQQAGNPVVSNQKSNFLMNIDLYITYLLTAA